MGTRASNLAVKPVSVRVMRARFRVSSPLSGSDWAMPRAFPRVSPKGKRVPMARTARVEGQSARGRAERTSSRAEMALTPSSGLAAWAFFPAQWTLTPSAVSVRVKTAPDLLSTAPHRGFTSPAVRPSTWAWASGGTTFCRKPPFRAVTRGRAVSRAHWAPKSGW